MEGGEELRFVRGDFIVARTAKDMAGIISERGAGRTQLGKACQRQDNTGPERQRGTESEAERWTWKWARLERKARHDSPVSPSCEIPAASTPL